MTSAGSGASTSCGCGQEEDPRTLEPQPPHSWPGCGRDVSEGRHISDEKSCRRQRQRQRQGAAPCSEQAQVLALQNRFCCKNRLSLVRHGACSSCNALQLLRPTAQPQRRHSAPGRRQVAARSPPARPATCPTCQCRCQCQSRALGPRGGCIVIPFPTIALPHAAIIAF